MAAIRARLAERNALVSAAYEAKQNAAEALSRAVAAAQTDRAAAAAATCEATHLRASLKVLQAERDGLVECTERLTTAVAARESEVSKAAARATHADSEAQVRPPRVQLVAGGFCRAHQRPASLLISLTCTSSSTGTRLLPRMANSTVTIRFSSSTLRAAQLDT